MKARVPYRPLARRLLLFAWLLAAGGADAFACSCVGRATPCAAFKGAGVVFVGTVKAVTRGEQAGVVLPVNSGGRWQIDKSPVLTVSLRVDEPLKGVGAATSLDLVTATHTAACGYPFKVGESYLVYAGYWKDVPGGRAAQRGDEGLPSPPANLTKAAEDFNKPLSSLTTNICARTRALDNARDDLALVRALLQGRPTARIFGRISEEVHKLSLREFDREYVGPLANVTVEAVGAAGRFEAATDAEGRYSIADLPPGTYRVRALLPDPYDLYSGDKNRALEVEVTREGCGEELSFTAHVDGRISGRVYGADGRPVGKDVQVSVVTLESARRGGGLAERRSEWTDAEGRYEFEGLPPGKYVLGVSVADAPYSATPYPATYHPSVGDVGQATVIVLGAGEKLGDFDIRLPRELPRGRVRGVVARSDGRPAKGADVYLYDQEVPEESAFGLEAEADAAGRFVAPCFKGRRYKLRASLYDVGPGGGEFESEKVEVRCDDAPPPVKVMLVKKEEGAPAKKEEPDEKPR